MRAAGTRSPMWAARRLSRREGDVLRGWGRAGVLSAAMIDGTSEAWRCRPIRYRRRVRAPRVASPPPLPLARSSSSLHAAAARRRGLPRLPPVQVWKAPLLTACRRTQARPLRRRPVPAPAHPEHRARSVRRDEGVLRARTRSSPGPPRSDLRAVRDRGEKETESHLGAKASRVGS